MDLDAMTAELKDHLGSRTLLEPDRIADRLEALDFLDFAEEALTQRRGLSEEDRALLAQTRALRDRLTRVDQGLFTEMRARLRNATLRGTELRQQLDPFTDYRRGAMHYRHYGMEGLDALIDGVLHPESVPEHGHNLAEEMIGFQPSPISAILELTDHIMLTPQDAFYDLGSGLGTVVILVHLLTGVTATGIEVDPALADYADGCAKDLQLRATHFLTTDARDADLIDGTCFYLFTPFIGTMLDEVMARLAAVAQDHPIQVASYGPSTPRIAREPWLQSRSDYGDDEFRLAVFTSR